MTSRLSGKAAIVTGAGQGIGDAIARDLADKAAFVIVAELDEATGAQLATDVAGRFVRTDVTVRNDIDRLRQTVATE